VGWSELILDVENDVDNLTTMAQSYNNAIEGYGPSWKKKFEDVLIWHTILSSAGWWRYAVNYVRK